MKKVQTLLQTVINTLEDTLWNLSQGLTWSREAGNLPGKMALELRAKAFVGTD